MHYQRLRAAAALLLTLATFSIVLGACDNVGRVWDPGGGAGGGRGPNPATQTQLPPEGARVVSARPQVVEAFPKGSDWQLTTPVVVLFTEAMNIESLQASSEENPQHLFARVKAQGNTTEDPPPIAASYDLLLGGRLLIMRPNQPFQPGQTIEVFAGNAIRDIDRATLSTTGVLAEFTIATSEGTLQVVGSFPRDSERDVERQTTVYTIFSNAIDASSISNNTLFVRKRGENDPVPVLDRIYPVMLGPVGDPRIVGTKPAQPLEPSENYDFVWTSDITAGDQNLDPGAQNPPVRFTTSAPLRVKSVKTKPVTVGTTTFENKINISNLSNIEVDVELPAGSQVGDRILVRVYGTDPAASPTPLLTFFEFEGAVTADGERTETLALGNLLGDLGNTKVTDGDLTIAARVSRGNVLTGFISSDDALLDTVRPTFEDVVPAAAGGTNVFLTDMNAATLQGKANEQLGHIELTVLSNTVGMFGSGEDGSFQSLGFFLNRQVADVPFTLNIADRAGNLASGAVNGMIRQRGFVTGSVSGGTLTVFAYDDATLEPIGDVDVLVEPGFPDASATGRVTGKTDTSGVATFTGLSQAKYSITLVKNGYHMFSLLNTAAGTVSLPLRPQVGATASVSGGIGFTALPNFSAEVGVNLLEDAGDDYRTATARSLPNVLGNTDVRPNRPLAVTAFAGIFPATTNPAFFLHGHTIRKATATATTNIAPPQPVAAGETYELDLTLRQPTTSITTPPALFDPAAVMLAPVSFNLSTAAGLDTTKLVDNVPSVRFLLSLAGYAGMSMIGTGFASGAGTSYSGNGTFSVGAISELASLGPILWMSMHALDEDGNISRSRALIADPTLPVGLVLAPFPGVATVASPSGTFTDSPEVEFEDRLAAGSVATSLGIRQIKCVDPAGREWVALYVDEDAAVSGAKVQLPVLDGTGLTRLANGAWAVSIDDSLLLAPGLSASEFNFEDIRRLELGFSRSKAETYTVQ